MGICCRSPLLEKICSLVANLNHLPQKLIFNVNQPTNHKMASLQRYVREKETHSAEEAKRTTPTQGRRPETKSQQEILGDLRAIFKDESDENLLLFANQFQDKKDMDLEIAKMLDNDTTVSQFLSDWNIVTSKHQRLKGKHD